MRTVDAGRVAPQAATLLPFPPSHTGGITTFVRELNAVLNTEYAVDLCLIASKRFTASPGRRVAQLLVAIRHLVQLLRFKPDIVHTHEHPFWPDSQSTWSTPSTSSRCRGGLSGNVSPWVGCWVAARL